MAWGALIGLGEGLKQVGGMILDDNKQKLAQKLELDREARAEARADRIFQREQSTFDHSAVEQSPEGVWMQVDYAKSGKKMDSRLAPPNIISDMNNKAMSDKVNLENSILQGKKTQAELDYAPIKQDLDRRDTESNIQYRERTGLAATMRADTPEKIPSFEDTVDDLVKDSSAIRDQYTKGSDDAEALMTPSEYRMVVRDVVKAAAQRGADPRAFLAEALSKYTRDRRSPAGKKSLAELMKSK